ncbi:MAG: OmpA family protein, partial [Polyangiaceae bacterium]|nr:OmpA family protein [Polyangiaceae bacterium]
MNANSSLSYLGYPAARKLRFARKVIATLLGAGFLFSATGCSQVSALRGRLSATRELADAAERNGAQQCTPRELALTRAYLEFAELELSEGSLAAAEDHMRRAELNAEAAHLQSPPQFCTEKEVIAVVAPPKPAPGDRDGDGFLDPDDRCVDQPENFNGYEDLDGCPDDPDTDGDGITDSKDPCVIEAEDIDGYLDNDGCPDADNDLDGVLDVDDNCALEGEDPDGYEDKDGCPDLDNDGDQVPDLEDQCPNTPG